MNVQVAFYMANSMGRGGAFQCISFMTSLNQSIIYRYDWAKSGVCYDGDWQEAILQTE